MNEHLYTITKSITEDNYLYEQVESCGQRGVRCRIYLSEEEMFKNCFTYYTDKQKNYISKIVKQRYINFPQKIECVVWCWPGDKFSFKIGKELAKERVDEKIHLRRNNIKSYIKYIENHNLSNKVKKVLKIYRDEY